MNILGIDPGETTGVATFVGGVLRQLDSATAATALGKLEGMFALHLGRVMVVLEDSRLTKKVFTAPNASPAARLKIARNIGEVDGMCKRILELCALHGVPCLSISPLGKGTKIKKQDVFNAHTGWSGKSNQHTRDAAMVAWPHRNKRA